MPSKLIEWPIASCIIIFTSIANRQTIFNLKKLGILEIFDSKFYQTLKFGIGSMVGHIFY